MDFSVPTKAHNEELTSKDKLRQDNDTTDTQRVGCKMDKALGLKWLSNKKN